MIRGNGTENGWAAKPAAPDLQPSAATAPIVRRRPLSDTAWGYIFLTPWLIGLTVFLLGPTLVSLYLSFTDFNLVGSANWIGTQNYSQLFFEDIRYRHALEVTFTYVLLAAPLNLICALALAMVLNSKIRGIGLYRAMYYVPSLLGGSVAIAILWRQIFGLGGVFSELLSMMSIHGSSWVSTPKRALYTLIILHVWQFGSPMIIFLAGLKQIPKDLYEAAEIDGAGPWRRFWLVTLPLLTPVIFFNLVLQIINSFQAFTPAFIVSGGQGGPLDSTLFYTLYLYLQGFTSFRMGYASAMGWILLVIIGLFTALAFLSSRYWVHYDDSRN